MRKLNQLTVRSAALLLLIFTTLSARAQNSDTLASDDRGIIVLPVVFFSPETSVGFGAASMYYFRTDTMGSKPSNIQAIGIYTLENQLLAQIPYSIFFEKDKYWLTGEVDYFIFPYQYYGSGTNVDLDTYAPYEASFFRFQLDAYRKIGKKSYFGPRVRFDYYHDFSTESSGNLISDDLTGFMPGTVSGLGLGYIVDNRNNLFAPSVGSYLEVSGVRYSPLAASDYTFTDVSLDLRKYIDLPDRHELGFQFFHQSVVGPNIPFYNEALLGGGKIMRGYYQGAYRDNHHTSLQGEYRYYLFDRILAAAFASAGSVGNQFGTYDLILPAGGLGLRYEIDKKEKIRIRLDFAVGRKTSGFYLNINEAF